MSLIFDRKKERKAKSRSIAVYGSMILTSIKGPNTGEQLKSPHVKVTIMH